MSERATLLPDGYGTQFEQNYLTRTYKKITNRPDLALTELVANAWDSGAETVRISLPQITTMFEASFITIEDDGIGMTEDEFHERWMTLGYNRLQHQGEFAEMPEERSTQKRRAYGRNGIGRHSMFCFADKYTIETWKDGTAYVCEIAQSGGHTALQILSHHTQPKNGHGTLITARVDRNFPVIKDISDILSARFMFDPKFNLYINNVSIGLEDYAGATVTEVITLPPDLTLHITALSSNRTARRSQQHGVAFWVNKRLVGDPSWTLGKRNLADGRTTIAKQYTIIVETDDLLSDILEDWTGFQRSDRVEMAFDAVESFVNKLFKDMSRDKNEELKRAIVKKYASDIQIMDHSTRREVLTLVDQIVDESPDMSKSFLEVAVSKFIAINQSHNKRALLERIFSLDEGDAERLNKLLDDWDISDMEFVLDEIDRRLASIRAIERYQAIEGADELHILHPLVLEAKWLFGPEYDSSFYASNNRLSTIMRKHLKKPEAINSISVPRKRPDIILFDDGSMIGYATEDYNNDTSLFEFKHLLLIELKCGGKSITPTEVSQTEEYMNELYFSNAFNSRIRIDAYTVGEEISGNMGKTKSIADKDDYKFGKIVCATYSQLIATAEKRLFGLKEQLSERYDSLGSDDLLAKALHDGTAQVAMEYALKVDP